jgi:hypothetical protein
MSNVPKMKTVVKTWKIATLVREKDNIDLNPAYQRGQAWKPDKQALLIDSIARNIDLPKLYLAQSRVLNTTRYEVIDGQQRVRAILDFSSGQLKIPSDTFGPNSVTHQIGIDDISAQHRKDFNAFGLTVAIVHGASSTFKRTLFERLQLGERLNSVEIRNALPSSVPVELRSIAETHPFFPASGIKSSRYRREDYLTHIAALLAAGRDEGVRDIKAPYLRSYVLEQRQGIPKQHLRIIDDILTYLRRVVAHAPKALRNKWSFVDAAMYCNRNIRRLHRISAAKVGAGLLRVEEARIKYNRTSESLLATACRVPYKEELYHYIHAYKAGAALTQHLRTRAQYLDANLP